MKVTHCKWCGTPPRYPNGLPKEEAIKIKKFWTLPNSYKKVDGSLQQLSQQPAVPASAGIAPVVAIPKVSPAVKTSFRDAAAKAVSKVTPPGVVETAAAVEAAKAAHLEAIAQAVAKKELEETAAVESERSEEIESLVLQIKFETSYMKALDGQTCPMAEQRRAMHSANIRWYQHQKTALMEPAKQVKALTVAVGTAEKKVLAAGKVLEFAKADVVRSQEAVASALEQVEIASTNFMDVKEQLEAAQVKVDAMDTPKNAEILIGDAAATVMSHCTAAQKNIFLEFLKTLESTAGDADMGTAAVSSDPYQAVGGAMPTASSLPAAAAPGTSTNAAARAPSRIPLRTAARLRSGSAMQARIPPVSATSDPYQSIGAATSAPAAVAAPRAEAVPTATHLVKAVTNSIAGVLHQQMHGFPFPKHQVQVNADGGIDTTQSTAADQWTRHPTRNLIRNST